MFYVFKWALDALVWSARSVSDQLRYKACHHFIKIKKHHYNVDESLCRVVPVAGADFFSPLEQGAKLLPFTD